MFSQWQSFPTASLHHQPQTVQGIHAKEHPLLKERFSCLPFRETATEIAPFPKSFFASPTPENNRLKKEIEVSNYPKSFTNLGRQPSPNNHYAKPKISFEKVINIHHKITHDWRHNSGHSMMVQLPSRRHSSTLPKKTILSTFSSPTPSLLDILRCKDRV